VKSKKRSKLGWIAYLAIIALTVSLIGLFLLGYTITEDKQIKKLIPKVQE